MQTKEHELITRRELENNLCVDANKWAEAFMQIKDGADDHEVKLWFAACLSAGFICGQRDPSYSSLQQSHPLKNNGNARDPLP